MIRKENISMTGFGLITYGTYDLTNLALIKEWPWIVTVVDMGWGAVLAAIVSYVGFLSGTFLSVNTRNNMIPYYFTTSD